MLKARACGLVVLLLLVCSQALGQINVPSEAEEHTLIPATLDRPIPDGAYLGEGGWEIVGATLSQVPSIHQCTPMEIWFTGAPGDYVVMYDGIILKDVTFTDNTGKEIKFTSYLGRIKGRSVCKIKGAPNPGPTPDPTPPPVPPGARVAVILEETLERTPQQTILWDQLRKLYPVGKLEILDDDKPTAKKYVDLCELTERPVLLVLTEKGELIREVACPGSVADVQKEVVR